MSTVVAAVVGLAVLSAAGLAPVLVAVGRRWIAVPLVPLAGAAVASSAAAAYVAFGVSFLAWFVVLAFAVAAASLGWWALDPGRSRPEGGPGGADRRVVVAGAVGAAAIAVACAASLRGLRTPTVGFDARALWVMRPGWFLQSHHQLLIDLKVRDLVLTQSAYPPLVSAASAVAWKVTGVHTARLGVVVTSLLNACALAAAALAVCEVGRRAAVDASGRRAAVDASGRRAWGGASGARASGDGASGARASGERPPWVPMVAGIGAAVLLVLVAAGITEPFLTNGYADPIWSLAAVGAVAWGLQSPGDRAARAAAVVLVLVAGGSKDEGFVTAVAIIGLIALRSLAGVVADHGWRARWSRWAGPVALAAAELAVIGAWPELMRAVGARGASSTFTLRTELASRSSAVAHGMAPYLHVLVVAVPVAAVGGLVLSGVRRRTGTGNDLWAWAALLCGLVAVAGALVTGQGEIGPWLRSTVHRITEFPALAAWWIVATWGVVAVCGLTTGRHGALSGDEASGAGVPVDAEPVAVGA